MKPRPSQPAPAPQAEPRLTQIEMPVQIEKPIYGGAFLARVEGKAVFVPLTLPGEQARIRIVEDKRAYATAEAEEIVTVAPERVVPACRHFGVCGGCHYQHSTYHAQLQIKEKILRETLERAGVRAPKEISVLAAKSASESWAYRNRIRLAFDAAGNPGYRGRRSHAVVPIAECPIAAPLLVRAAQAAAEIARRFALPLTEISLFCNAVETALLASVFTASPAKIRFEDFAQALHEQVPALEGSELLAAGRDRQPPRTLAQWGANSLTYSAAGFPYRVDRGAFFQVNRWLIDTLVEQVAANHSGALAWDLFAGVGLFARRLATRFARVVAVESAPAATAALAHNLSGTNATAVQASTLDFLRRPRKTGRPDLIVPDLIVVDPPRTGLGPETCKLLAQSAAPTLVYVSCDPATLARDLRALLTAGYAIQSITLADLFPHTFHLETVVELRRA
jgi:23S rRNA (uracil1939-C5)-methyltransferase